MLLINTTGRLFWFGLIKVKTYQVGIKLLLDNVYFVNFNYETNLLGRDNPNYYNYSFRRYVNPFITTLEVSLDT